MANELDTTFAALADPTRRAVIERLASGPATVSELAEPHAIALPTFMRHLKVLERSGLVRSVKKGRVRTCHIEEGPLTQVQGWLVWQRRIWESHMDRDGALAAALAPRAKG
ncbi:metalloregulator ArsR/SmtB family transcription factor [Salibaculum sp.]|uniref:ArsR/SmtB family transcription factor n=1 Tax=Salibaculum sp. TaxID=2855480 RepID=UPI002B477C56|nr:metalloregulator ArsR/SmtB family transcription factor [Salibaculum sp.]HKL68240.1 metalloregulator ArsR/SmtB family transcription factor [Salibaculum sp.]